MDKYIIGFLTAIDNFSEAIAKLFESKPKKKKKKNEKKRYVRIAIVSVIVKMNFTCIAINKIYALATIVNVKINICNYLNILN